MVDPHGSMRAIISYAMLAAKCGWSDSEWPMAKSLLEAVHKVGTRLKPETLPPDAPVDVAFKYNVVVAGQPQTQEARITLPAFCIRKQKVQPTYGIMPEGLAHLKSQLDPLVGITHDGAQR